MVSTAEVFGLGGDSLHLAVDLFDRVLSLRNFDRPVGTEAGSSEDPSLLAAACLKIADVFHERSKEYYQQENAREYSQLQLLSPGGTRFSPEDLVAAEKHLLRDVGLADLDHPTTPWFLRWCLDAVGLTGSAAAAVANFSADLSLLDAELQAAPAALRAQVAVVLALYVRSWTSASSASSSTARVEEATSSVLKSWQPVRQIACANNKELESAMCLRKMSLVLSQRRREWKTANLTAIEAKHHMAGNLFSCPEVFPAGLAEFLLPEKV
jgi:hypothetical protein